MKSPNPVMTQSLHESAPLSVETFERIESLNRILVRMAAATPLPEAVAPLIATGSDSSFEARRLVSVLRANPDLAERVLRCVRSPEYTLHTDAADVASAVASVGFREVRNLAIMISLAELFTRLPCGGGLKRNLWKHSLAVATIAARLAHWRSKTSAEDAFLAGLLHDVGLAVIARQMPEGFCTFTAELTDGRPICEVEREVYNVDHTQVGEYVALVWGFPEPITVAIGHHHTAEAYAGPHPELLYLVTTADYLVSRKGIPALDGHQAAPPHDKVFAALEFTGHQLELAWRRLDRGLAAAAALEYLSLQP